MAAGKRSAGKSSRRKKRRGRGKKILAAIAAAAAVIYIAAAAYLYIEQRSFIYHPTVGVQPTGESEIEIDRGDAVLRGWIVNPGREHAVIYFGGNAERIENCIPDYRDLFPEHTVYFVNYRGYGESTGTPTEGNLCSDAVAIYDAVIPDHENITVLGRSLGTGVAAYLAANRQVHQLILVTPFDCLENIAADMYPIFPVGLIMKDRFDSAELAPRITAPTLVIMAENDSVIPRESTERLISAFDPATVQTAVIENATHDDIQAYTQYLMRIRDFQLTGN